MYFIGPLLNPLNNEWVLYAGLISCALVLPLALICGPLRGIPLHWRLIARLVFLVRFPSFTAHT